MVRGGVSGNDAWPGEGSAATMYGQGCRDQLVGIVHVHKEASVAGHADSCTP